MSDKVFLIRRDLDSIVRVLNRFGKTKEGDAVKMSYGQTAGGYYLELHMTEVVHGLVCDVKVEIDQYIVDELNDLDEADAKAQISNP